MSSERRQGVHAEPEAFNPAYLRIVKSQLDVNLSQVDELRVALRLQRSKLGLLSFCVLVLLVGVLPTIYAGWRSNQLAAGAVNVVAVFVFFAVFRLSPLLYTTVNIIWRIHFLLMMQHQAIRLAERELEGGGVAAE